MTLAVTAVSACAVLSNDDSSSMTAGQDTVTGAADAAVTFDRPVVEEVGSGRAVQPFLDAGAEPRTALGRLRARHMPVWTPDFDWAFPPEVCNSAWEFDAVATPDSRANIAILGDFSHAAALSVMRYEHYVSRSLADPSAPAQLCVAITTVDPHRSEILEVLASHITAGSRFSGPAAHPDAVVLLAANATSVMAVACVTPGYSDVKNAEDEVIEPTLSEARLQAYLLGVSRGMEDTVTDISYRVSNTTGRGADDCTGLDAWVAEWDGHVQQWVAEGQIWEPLWAVVTVADICDSPAPEFPNECPRAWLLS